MLYVMNNDTIKKSDSSKVGFHILSNVFILMCLDKQKQLMEHQ
jgi:hypothetical protein